VFLKGGIPAAEPRLFDQSSLQLRLEQAFDSAARQVRLTVERTPDYFPIYTVGGR
jgi:unsaturated chondroitin disaccharide hydrolase